jgi:Cu(I)/Ag(I) efflux system membrane fusion protein
MSNPGRPRLRVLASLLVLALVLPSACHKSSAKRSEAPPPPAKKIMYRSTMMPNEVSDKPGKDSMGMDMVPFEVEEKPAPKPEAQPKKKIMYRSTMIPGEVSEKPGKDSMGMEMVPYEVEETAPAVSGRVAVRISPERQQLIGVRTTVLKFQPITRTIRAVGRVAYAEPRVKLISLKFDGWIERLYVDRSGMLVRKGQPLFDIYSPDLVAAEQEYLLAVRARNTLGEAGESVLKSARERLRLWDIGDKEVEALERTGEVRRTLSLFSPDSGFVVEKRVLEGQRITAGEELFKIADLSRVWVLGDVYEYELPFIKNGQDVAMTLTSFPGREFRGTIAFIYPYLNPATRTNTIRVDVANPGFMLKPEMYANLSIREDLGRRLAVPADAIISSGQETFAFVDKGGGYLEPRRVKLGVKGTDVYEVLSGLAEGERVVTSANFLIDSESSLKAALEQMTRGSAGDGRRD